jgi:hypothetical protein
VGELESAARIDGKIRRSGGGRKTVEDNYPDIEDKIRRITDGKTYDDPMRVLSYTTESLRKIRFELEKSEFLQGMSRSGKFLIPWGTQASQSENAADRQGTP